jgi:hypothetical protein
MVINNKSEKGDIYFSCSHIFYIDFFNINFDYSSYLKYELLNLRIEDVGNKFKEN